MKINTLPTIALAVFGIALVGGTANAQLVQNGGFESATATNGQVGDNVSLTDWTLSASPGYTFLFSQGSVGTPSGPGVSGSDGTVNLWGTTAALDGSANGGNFVGADPIFQAPAALQQTITGLTVGATYTLTFDYAGAQQTGFSGATTDGWTVQLGSSASQNTPVINLLSETFSGWFTDSMQFTANATSEVLSFLAYGGPPAANGGSGEPPFSLLDGVSLTQNRVPEPASLAIFGTALAGLGFIRRRRRKSMSGMAA